MDKAAGIQMKSEVTGTGDPIVLVPGGLTGWISWKPHAEQLAINRRVVRVQLLAVDLGLQGALLPSGYSVRFESEALLKTLDEIGVEKADFAAWSYGAEITLDFVLNHPERVRTLTLIEPPAIWVLRSRGPLPSELIEEQKTFQKLAGAEISEEQLEWFTHFAGFVPPGENPRELPQWPVWVEHRQSLRTGDVVYRHEDDIARVRSFKKPALLFKGEGSPEFLQDIIDILGQEFPYAQVEMLPGAHALHIVSMERFMATLNKFLKES